MPVVLDSYEFPEATTNEFGKSVYDWDTLLDGKIYQLKQGEDFNCKLNTIMMMTRKNAKSRGLKVRVSKVDDTTVVIQQVGVLPASETPEQAPAAPQANGAAHPPTPAAKPPVAAQKPAAPAAAPKPAAPAAKPQTPAPKPQAKPADKR